NRTGGTVNFTGTLTGNLALTAATGSWNILNGGTIKDGTFTATGGAALVIQNGAFDGVTANAPLDLTGIPNLISATLRIYNGLTLNTTATVGRADESAGGWIVFGDGSAAGQTLGGTGTVLLAGSAVIGNNAGGEGA